VIHFHTGFTGTQARHLGCEFAFDSEHRDDRAGGFAVTAMCALNAVPARCTAALGVVAV